MSTRHFDILTNGDESQFIAEINRVLSELPEISRDFTEALNGLSPDQIKEDKQALKVIELMYVKSSVLSSNIWSLYKLSQGLARPAESKEEWDKYTIRVLGDMRSAKENTK